MKNLLLVLFVLLSSYSFPQDGFYNWINHSTLELKRSFGEPADIAYHKGDSMYTYQTELGYSSFLIKSDYIYKNNNTTYWKKKSKAKSALNYLLDLYKKDGFKIENQSREIYRFSSPEYKIKLELYYLQDEKLYAVSETAENNPTD